MRSVSSAFWLALQGDNPSICELISHGTAVGTFNWTSNNQPMVSSGVTYDPFPGGNARGSEESTTLSVGNIGFTIVNSGQYYNLLRSGQLDNTEVYVRRVLINSPDLGILPVFRGKLGDLVADRLKISGTARNAFQSATIQWPYYTYMDTCVWKFGGVGCGVNASSFTFVVSFDTSSSSPILLRPAGQLANLYAPGQLERGRVTILTGVNSGQVRTIRTSTGDLLLLAQTLPFTFNSGDVVGMSIQRGCRKRLVNDCVGQFNNGNRHFAAPWMPRQEQAF